MGNNNTLMFKVGIADIKTELDKHKKEIESWVNSNPIKLKVQLEDSSLEQLATKLKAMGATFGESNAEVKKLQEELTALKTLLNSIVNSAGTKPSSVTNELQTITKGSENAIAAMNQLSKIVEETKSKTTSGKGFLFLDRIPPLYTKLLMDIENKMTSIGKIMSEGNLPSWLDDGKGRGFMNNIIQDYERLLRTMRQMNQDGFIDFHNLRALRDVFNGLNSAYGPLINQAKEYNKEVDKNAKAEEKAINQNIQTREKKERDYQKVWEQNDKARIRAAEALDKKIANLEARKLVDFKGMDTAKLDAAINKLKAIRDELKNFRTIGSAEGIMKGMGLPVVNREAIAAIHELNSAKRSGVTATTQLADSEQRLANAIRNTTDTMRGQSQVLSDLKMMAYQYLSIWGAQTFLNNIIEIGGQLEMQRMSIGSILQNTAQANTLFERIKGLAVQSPFGVVELDQMTKQLTAYGFKYNELFDMTKRLADISAATGTGVDRLALALGHVRSEAALSGYTLRQFAMGNVPLLGKLAENLGKSTEEIRKMVRAKQITYDDVVKVLKELTNEGGMFYNMQEVISESVKAKFKNVKDAMSIMYGEMAEGAPGDVLKEVAMALMEVAKNWRDAMTIIGTSTGLWAVHRMAILAYTKVLGSSNATTLASIAAFRQKEAAQLRLARSYRTLDSAEKSAIATAKIYTMQERIRMALGISLTQKQKLRIQYSRQQMIMDRALALTEKALTAEDIARQVALGKLTKAEATQIIALADMTAAERASALSAVNNVRTYGKFTAVINGSAIAVNKLGMALKSLILNPQVYIMAGITAVMEMWQRNTREMELAEEISEKIYNTSQEALKNTSTMLTETGIKAMWKGEKDKEYSDVSGNFGKQLGGELYFELPKFNEEDATQAIDKWAQYIREYAATPNRILNDAFFDTEGNARSLEDQFYKLAMAARDVARAQMDLAHMGDTFEYAINSTNKGWLDDDVITNIKDYDKTLKSFRSNINSTYKQYRARIDRAIEATREQSEVFRNNTRYMNTYVQQLQYLIENQDRLAKSSENFKNADSQMSYVFKKLSDSHWIGDAGYADVIKQKATMEADLESFYIHMEADLERQGIKIGSMSEAQQQDLLIGYKEKLSSIQGLSDETYQYLMKRFARRFGIELDVNDEKFRKKTSEVERILNELVNGTWSVPLNFSTNITDVIKEARKQYKTATEYFANVKPILMKFGIEWEKGKVMTDDEIDAALANVQDEAQKNFLKRVLKGLNEANKLYNNATKASQTGGFSLDDTKKKDKKTGSSEDKEAKRLRERVRILKEANESYQYWRKKVGDTAAESHVGEEFGKLLKEQDFDYKDAKQYEETLKSLREEYQKIYDASEKKGKKRPQLLEAIKEIDKILADIGRKDFEKTTDEWASAMSRDIEELTRKWEIFNSVVSDTGDKMLAARISGISPGATPADLKRANVSSAAGVNIDFDRVLGMSDTEIDEYVYTLGLAEEKIKAIQDGLKDWKKAEQDMYKSDIQNYAKWLGSLVDLETKRTKNQEEYNEVVRETMRLLDRGVIDEKEASRRITTAQFDRDKKDWQDTSTYSRLYGNAQMMAEDEFYGAYNKEMANLFDQYKKGEITISEYADKVSNLNKIASEFSTSGFLGIKGGVGAYLSGGYQGLIDYHRNKATDLRKQGKEDEAKEEEEKAASMEKAQKAAEQLAQTFSDLASGANLVANLFDALGMEGAANAFGDAAGVLGGVTSGAQSLSALGPWGMAVGGAIGGLTSIFALSDKNHERRIQELKQEVTKIDNTLNTIKSLRERELGYDSGSLRRQMAAMYKSAYYSSSNDEPGSTIRGMREYYGRYSGGNGYSQEYNALVETRKKYMEMYDEEYEKKKSSSEALEEYKTKIAELDEQIMFFTQDLANELWGIDIQGWADQISDSLWTAFENGEDALEVFHKTAKEIISDVAKRMMTLSLIEPAFKRLQNALFGEYDMNTNTYKGGAIKYDSNGNIMMQESEEDVLKVLGQFFGEGGEMEKNVEAAEMLYKWVEKITGFDLSSDESKSGASSSIKNITESTADLLAAYLNAVRASVSKIEFMDAEYYPKYLQLITSCNLALTSIQTRAKEIADSNAAIERNTRTMADLMNGLKNKTWKLPIA